MKKLITILVAVAIAGCTKQINPTDNYHVVIKAYDTNHVLLHGRLTIGGTTLNIRKGYSDSTLVDTVITDDVNNGLSYAIYNSIINRNCTLSEDTTGLIKLNITSSTYTYNVSGTSILQ